jgi:hypothetical protein
MHDLKVVVGPHCQTTFREDIPQSGEPSKNELKKRAKAAEKERKAAEKAAKLAQQEREKVEAEEVRSLSLNPILSLLFMDLA